MDEGRVGPVETRTGDDALRFLREKQVDGIIPACTEFPFFLGGHMQEPDVLDPVRLLAEAAVREALK